MQSLGVGNTINWAENEDALVKRIHRSRSAMLLPTSQLTFVETPV